MRTPRSRRALLTSMVGLSLGTAGCFEGELTGSEEPLDSGVVPADTYDCDDVERPEPSPPSREDALEPASYPVPPNELFEAAEEPELTEAVKDYVREFEAAYRRNTFIEEYGSETDDFEIEFDDTWRTKKVDSESDREAVLVATVYERTRKTRLTDPETEQYTRVTYYVDGNIVLRARYDGIAEGAAFDPDPRSEGDPVACFTE